MKTDHEMEQELKALRWEAPPDTDRRILDDAQRALDQARSRRRLVMAAWLLAAAALVILVVAGTFLFTRPGPVNTFIPREARRHPLSPQDDSGLALSLARLTAMSDNPDRLLDYLDSHSRPLRSQDESPLSFTRLNRTWN